MVKVWRVILAALVIFGAGMATGVMTARLTSDRSASAQSAPPSFPMGMPQKTEMLNRMTRRLELSPEQHDRIEKILKDSHERMKALWEPVAPKAKEETRQVREQILAQLTEPQKAKFEEVFKPRGQRKPFENREEWRRREFKNGPQTNAAGQTSTNRPSPPAAKPAP